MTTTDRPSHLRADPARRSLAFHEGLWWLFDVSVFFSCYQLLTLKQPPLTHYVHDSPKMASTSLNSVLVSPCSTLWPSLRLRMLSGPDATSYRRDASSAPRGRPSLPSTRRYAQWQGKSAAASRRTQMRPTRPRRQAGSRTLSSRQYPRRMRSYQQGQRLALCSSREQDARQTSR